MVKTIEEIQGYLAELHDEETNGGQEEPEEDWFNRAKHEVKMMDIALKQLQNYSISGERPDIIQDNAQDVKLTFSSLTAQRFKIGKKELDDSIAYLHFAKQFTDEHPEDAVSKDLKGAILFIQQYLKEMDIEAPEEYGYPKYGYKPGEYYPYQKYEKGTPEREKILRELSYSEVDRHSVNEKMLAHAKHASELLRKMEHVPVDEPIPESLDELMTMRLSKALKDIRERRAQEPELSTDFPEQLRQARQEKLAKYDPTEPSREYKIAKEASRRLREQLAKQGKITATEE